jgi:hypothetical protein
MQAIVSLNGKAIASYSGVSQLEALQTAEIEFPRQQGDLRVAEWAGSYYTSTKMAEIQKFLAGDSSARANQQDVDFCPYL